MKFIMKHIKIFENFINEGYGTWAMPYRAEEAKLLKDLVDILDTKPDRKYREIDLTLGNLPYLTHRRVGLFNRIFDKIIDYGGRHVITNKEVAGEIRDDLKKQLDDRTELTKYNNDSLKIIKSIIG